MAVVFISAVQNYIGLSTDTKPTPVPAGSIFFEYDSHKTFITYDDGTTWIGCKGGS